MTVREVLINKGFQQGFQQGIQIDHEIDRQIGFQQGICHVAANILQSVVADEQIYQFTEISMDELDAIKQEQCETINTP